MLAARSKCFFREEHPLQLLLQAFDENAIFLNYQFRSLGEFGLHLCVCFRNHSLCFVEQFFGVSTFLIKSG